VLAERDREMERDKNIHKSKIAALENKVTKKKDKIKNLQIFNEDKDIEIERMKEELESLKAKTKNLNQKIKEERRISQ
jgi:SMC interacting uncharacterized protein involved in chromosome segregation